MKIKDILKRGIKTFEFSNDSNKFYLVIVALLIFFAYLPTLQYDYAPSDQWRAFRYSLLDISPIKKAFLCLDGSLNFDLRSGRPFCRIGECIEHAWVGKIRDFSKTRPIILIAVIFTAFCVGMVLSPSVGGIANGTAIGALFVLSPGYAYMYHIGLSAIMILLALILATLSYLLIRQVINGKFNKNKLLLSSVFFLIACMSYPVWALVVYVFSLIDFLFCEEPELNTRFKHLLIKYFFFSIIMIIYFLIIKFIIIFLPDYNMGGYEFSANFNPVYLGKRFCLAFLFYIAQPPLNTLFDSLRILNIIFLLSVIIIYSVSFFKKNHCKLKTIYSFVLIVFICVVSIFTSIAPWLVSNMSNLGNRYFISFSLFICTLICWIIFRVSTKLFPTKKYLSSVLIIFIVLLPASAIQNKRTSIEVGISGTEIETMRLFVHKWIDEDSFITKRYIVVVKPKRPRPLFYDRVLNNVKHGGLSEIPEDPLYYYKILSDVIEWRNNRSWMSLLSLNKIMSLAGYGDSLEFPGDSSYYSQMFTALIREKCSYDHPLFNLMKIYNISFSQERAEEILDGSPFNIVFTVVNQGEHIKTKHEILEINFSLITNSPEPLVLDQ